MGTPSPGWDSLVLQASVAARRRKRRRRARRMLWLLTVVTSGVLAVIAVFIMDISKVPTKVRPAALSASAGTVSGPSASATGHRAKLAGPNRHTVTYPQVTDVSSGLSYRMLGAPWRSGCPSNLNTPAFDWTAGENTVAGHVSIGGSVIDWHGLACSGQLQQQFPYGGPADLQQTAMSLVSALDPAYYAGVQHTRAIEASSATQVSGHRAWKIEFAMNYTDGASQGLTWSTELGAVVVVDRGAGQFPAVFYVSVPASLGTQNVATFLSSLRIS